MRLVAGYDDDDLEDDDNTDGSSGNDLFAREDEGSDRRRSERSLVMDEEGENRDGDDDEYNDRIAETGSSSVRGMVKSLESLLSGKYSETLSRNYGNSVSIRIPSLYFPVPKSN